MGNTRYIAIGEEVTFKTKTTETMKWMPVIECDLQPDQGKILIEESAYRLPSESVLGPFTGSGRVLLNVRADNIGWFLKWVTGKHTVGSPNYTHAFGAPYGETLKPFTMIDYRGGLTNQRWLFGCILRSLTLEAPARGVVTAELNILYSDELIDTIGTPLTPPALRPFIFHDGVVAWASAGLANTESFRYTWENTVVDDSHEIGSRFLPEVDLENLRIFGEFDLKFKSWAARKQFYGALESAVEPDNPQTEDRNFVILITLTEGGSGSSYYLKLDLAKCAMMENTAAWVRRERLTQRIGWEALYTATDQITLFNAVDDYADAT